MVFKIEPAHKGKNVAASCIRLMAVNLNHVQEIESSCVKSISVAVSFVTLYASPPNNSNQ